MTLVLNEIHLLSGLAETMMVAAADRRLTKPDGAYHSTRKKLFRVPHLHGAVSYFGMAAFGCGGREFSLSSWLPDFIKRSHGLRTVEEFAGGMQQELNRVVPCSVLSAAASGFQISGYDGNGLPTFWSLSNIGGMSGMRYTDLRPQYGDPVDDFLGRDARKLGWDGVHPLSAESHRVQYYRNGDFTMHIAAWEELDDALERLRQLPTAKGFGLPDDPASYGEYVRFKLEFIAYFYRRWARQQIIGRPIDVIVVTRLQGQEPSYVEVPTRTTRTTRGGTRRRAGGRRLRHR